MTEMFTASNGMRVGAHEKPHLGFALYNANGENTLDNMYSHLNIEEMRALREYFQDEQDADRGVWRSVADPTWSAVRRNTVIYFQNTDHERSFHFVLGVEGSITAWSHDLQDRAREYIDAHPESKPWHDAKLGEVWAIRIVDTVNHVACRVARVNDEVMFETTVSPLLQFRVASPRVADGRCIWPEKAL